MRGGDKVDKRRAVKARLGPLIVNTNLATTIAVARFGPPPATAAQAPRHWGDRGAERRIKAADHG